MLKTILKWAGIILLLIITTVVVIVLSRQNVKYSAPYPNIHAVKDSAVLARGKYLVYGPAHCADCHGAKGTDADVNAGKEVALSGGKFFAIPPGNIYMPNITPHATGIGNFKDEEIARALRYGVGVDGRALFDFMPFHSTSDEDLTAIISFLRSTAPVDNDVPKSEYSVLGKILKALVIKPVEPDGDVPKAVKQDSSIEYGKYLATSIANCRGCHTERDLKTGAFVGEYYAGGFVMQSEVNKKYFFHTPNLSPDSKTGHIADWTEEMFIKRFRKGKQIPESPMPWGPFSRMTDDELKAIYRYLKTVKPVERKIEKVLVIEN